jgi:protein O-mannosyl-transferase
LEKAPLLAMSIASSIITVIAQKTGGAVVPIEAMTLGQRIVNATVTYAMYLRKTAWPVDLAVFYPMQREISVAVVIGSVLILGVISVIAIAQRRKRPALIVGWLWYVGTLVPVIGLVQVGFQSMADRYTYVPLIGIFIMIAWAIPEVSVKAARVYAAGGAALLIAFAVGTWHQVGYWRDTYTLMNHAAEVTDNNFVAHTILGFAFSSDKDIQEAERHYRLAVEMNPRYGLARDNLGSVLLSQRRVDEALVHLREAARLVPNAATTRNNLGAALMDSGDFDAAIAEFQTTINLNPNLAGARLNLGRSLASKQRFPEALAQFQKALDLRPDWPEALVHLGISQASIGQLDDAIANFERALKLKPDNALARECLTTARQQRDQQQPK